MAMGQLLTTRASMDSHQRMLVSHTEIAIKEAKSLCTATIQDAEANCTATIREAETACVDCTHTLQWSLDESMQDFECKAIKRKGRIANPFSGCVGWLYKPVLQKSKGTHVPLTVADGECVLSCPFGYSTV